MAVKHRIEVNRFRLLGTVGVLLLLMTLPASAVFAWFNTEPLIIRFIGSFPGADSVQAPHGWPVTIEATARESQLLGIGTPWVPPFFPEQDEIGYLVFDDPDGCLSFLPDGIQASIICDGGAGTCVSPPGAADCSPTDQDGNPTAPVLIDPWPADETWVEITPGINTLQTFCIDPDCEEPRTVLSFDPNTEQNDRDFPVGPALGSLSDNYGFGPNVRLPGLFVSSTVGASVTSDPTTYQRTCQNIAGFFQNVGYQLSNSISRTSIRTHLNVPPALFKPVILIDNGFECQGTGADQTCKSKYQIDGGPPVVDDPAIGLLDNVVNNLEVTVKAFVIDVDETYDFPDSLLDTDFDGDCDADDAEALGYDVISNQATLRFTPYYVEFVGIGFDYDGDGFVGGIVLPAGPGGLTGPPR